MWDESGRGFMKFDVSDAGYDPDALGYIVENNVLNAALQKRMIELESLFFLLRLL